LSVIVRITIVLFLLVTLAFSVLLIIERSRIDPIEKAIGEALNNDKLRLGTPLGIWIDNFGEPDINFSYECPCGKGEYVGWSEFGFAVTSFRCEESQKEKTPRDDLLVDSIIIPIREVVYNRYPGREKNKQIEFEKILEVKINGKSLSDMTFEEIDLLYKYHYDSGEYSIYLHRLPEYIAKRKAGIQYTIPVDEKQRSGNPNWSEDIEQITISESGLF